MSRNEPGWDRTWCHARVGWVGRVLCVLLVSLMLFGGRVTPAQVTYTVFPVVPTVRQKPVRRTDQDTMRVTLAVQDSTLAYVLRTFTHQAHLHLLYNGNDPLFVKRITVNVADASLMDALAVVLKGTGLVAKLAPDGETVMIRAKSGSSMDNQARMVGGIVVGHVSDSASGAGLGGAQVRLAGVKNLTAVTSDSGNFTLRDVPTGDQVLTVRLFGYRPAERTVTVVDSQRTTVRIVMAAIPTVLSGVVTTATGLQRKVELGNDITTINVDSVMQVAPISSLTDLLETRVPGLTVLHSSGVPGDPSRLRLRGVGSITGNNDPVIIIDGIRMYSNQSDSRNNNLAPVDAYSSGFAYGTMDGNTRMVASTPSSFAAPSPVDQIDPSSIETIEVFKGPSASALYGSDAANGVIVITTKHGRAGPTHWTLNVGQGVNWLPGSWPINYFGIGKYRYDFGSVFPGSTTEDSYCSWADVSCVTDSVFTYQALNNPLYTVFSHGADRNASLNVDGGTRAMQYSLSGSAAGTLGNLKLPVYEQQRFKSNYGSIPSWVVRPDNYQTMGMNGSLTVHPNPALQVTFQSSLYNSHQQRSALDGSVNQLSGVLITSTGDLTSARGNFGPLSQIGLIKNFVQRATAGSQTERSNLTLNWQPRPWLPINATGGISSTQRTDKTYIPYGVAFNGGAPNSTNSDWRGDSTGYFGIGRGTSQNKTLTVGTSIPFKLVTAALGGNLTQEETADFSASTYALAPGVSTPTNFNICLVADNRNNCPTFGQATNGWSTYGWYFEPRLNFNSRFFVAPGFRLDGGSASGAHVSTNAGGINIPGLTGFPKIDFSYLAVDQSKPKGPISLLRPRIAYGYAGTQPAPTSKLRLINGTAPDLNLGGQGSLTTGGGCSIGELNGATINMACINSLGNTQLRPERSSELEGGVDLSLWRGRFNLTWTQYNKTRKDAILEIPVASSVYSPLYSTGGATIAANIGEVRNTGTEITLNTTVLESKFLSWSVGTNISSQNNVLVHLNPGRLPIVIGSQTGGTQVRITPGYPLFGLWARPVDGFADTNHDGRLELNEIQLSDSSVYVGSPNPNYNLNLTTDLSLLHGSLGIHATFAYQNGLTQNNAGALASGAGALLGNAPGTPAAQQAALLVSSLCSVVTVTYGSCGNASDIGLIQTVNTFRFNDLSINYIIPKRISRLLRAPRASIALQGSNLGLHTNYRGKDPNVNAFSTVSAGDETMDLGQIPQPRTWWLKLSLGN